MLGLLALVLLVWLICIVIGAVVKGLLWLLVIGAILFAITALVGFVKREAIGRR